MRNKLAIYSDDYLKQLLFAYAMLFSDNIAVLIFSSGI